MQTAGPCGGLPDAAATAAACWLRCTFCLALVFTAGTARWDHQGMSETWYPEKVMVGPEGTQGTYRFMQSAFGPAQHFAYAEFGIYLADTARNVCALFQNATLHLFDFQPSVERAQNKLSHYANRVYYYGNTQKYNDSYNWPLMQLIEQNRGAPVFDYCFLDGAHTVAVDALCFFLCDRLLRVGGYIDFDDYTWRLRGSSLDPARVPQIGLQYTDEQIDSPQVQMIVDQLVRRDDRYREVVKDKVFQKVAA
jgi:hypothetical protein